MPFQRGIVCSRDQVQEIYDMPLLELVFRAASVHRTYHDARMVQKCTLLSIKTGGCPEDCNYCSQSSKHSESTGTKATKLMDLEEVYEAAVRAKESGSTRFCMGAAWRGPSQVRRPVSTAHVSPLDPALCNGCANAGRRAPMGPGARDG